METLSVPHNAGSPRAVLRSGRIADKGPKMEKEIFFLTLDIDKVYAVRLNVV